MTATTLHPSGSTTRVGITKVFRFAAHHRLPYHDGKCQRDHGHNYTIEITVYGPIQPSGPEAGMVLDFGHLKADVNGLLDKLDHYSLNDDERAKQGAEPLLIGAEQHECGNPTAENLAVWLLDSIPYASRVVVWETDDSCAHAERLECPHEWAAEVRKATPKQPGKPRVRAKPGAARKGGQA